MVCCPFTFQSRLGKWVVNQQSGKEAQDMFPVNLMGLQNLLQLAQQLLHTEDHSQLEKPSKDKDSSVIIGFYTVCKSWCLNKNKASVDIMCSFISF